MAVVSLPPEESGGGAEDQGRQSEGGGGGAVQCGCGHGEKRWRQFTAATHTRQLVYNNTIVWCIIAKLLSLGLVNFWQYCRLLAASSLVYDGLLLTIVSPSLFSYPGDLQRAAGHFEAYRRLAGKWKWCSESGDSVFEIACEHLRRVYTSLAKQVGEYNDIEK